jgi:transposase-like protein
MNERMCLVAAYLDGAESISALCRAFGISRKTGHNWLTRYRLEGVVGLGERFMGATWQSARDGAGCG